MKTYAFELLRPTSRIILTAELTSGKDGIPRDGAKTKLSFGGGRY
jgi:hypothetical protein